MNINVTGKLFFILLTLFVFSGFTSMLSASNITLPEGVTNPSVIKHDNIIYIIGGNDDGGAKKTVNSYSLKTGEWKKLPEMEQARYGHSAVYYNGRIYVFGGLQAVNNKNTALSSVESMDVNTGVWRKENDMPKAKGRFGLTCIADKVYIFGGVDDNSSYLTSVEEFNLATGTWTEKGNLPSGINRLSSVISLDGTVYIIGGEGAEGKTLSSVFIYNTKENSFKEIAPLNHERENFASSAAGNKIIVAGGWCKENGKTVFLNSTEIYNPSSGKWEEGPVLKESRDGGRALFLEDILYVFGGYNGSLLSSVEEIKLNGISSGWKIDEEVKFHLAYLQEKNLENVLEENIERPKPLGFTSDYLPDIANINLAAIKGLGFPLPSREKNELYNLYLKLFEFPKSFDVRKSTIPVEKDYLLDKLQGSEIIENFISNPENVSVKMAFIAKSDEKFSKDNPFPSLEIQSKSDEFQKYFNSHTPFTSLYVNPCTEAPSPGEDRGEWSAQGVLDFHMNLIEAYKDNLIEMSGPEPEKYYYFINKNITGKDVPETVTVLKVPKTPMVFKNWKELLMPQDPEHVFLSGLLLVYRTEYSIKSMLVSEGLTESPKTVESEDFFKIYQETSATVLEIGSVVRVP